MEDNQYIFFALGGLMHGITHMAVIIACIILVIKQKNGATILMLIASILTLLFSLGSIVWNQIAARNGAESLVKATKIISVVGALPYILFAIGLLFFVIKHVKKQRREP